MSIRGNGTAVYLGNGWVLTANRTTGGDTTFNGQTFSEVPGTAFSLTNNGAVGKTANTDLTMFQINGMLTGVSTRALRWGTNAVGGTEQWISSDSRDVLTTWTTIEFADGTSEAQAVAGDFGGAVVPEPGAASLAGMALAVGAAWADSLSLRDKATGWAARCGATGLRGHVQTASLWLQVPAFQSPTSQKVYVRTLCCSRGRQCHADLRLLLDGRDRTPRGRARSFHAGVRGRCGCFESARPKPTDWTPVLLGNN